MPPLGKIQRLNYNRSYIKVKVACIVPTTIIIEGF